MNFCKASLLLFLTVSLLSTTKIVAVAEATHTQDEKASFFEGFSSEVITSFISLFSSSPESDSNPAVKASKTSDVSCYGLTLGIKTDDSPEETSWEVKNANTGEIIASQDEGFYIEAETWYTHDETICLDMDNKDICYDVVVNFTGNYTSPYSRIALSYATQDPVDEYSKWSYTNEMTVCSFDDFVYRYGCLVPDREPSCVCGDDIYCVLEPIFTFLLLVFIVVCFPCLVAASPWILVWYCTGMGSRTVLKIIEAFLV